mgnify:FL=1
MPEKNDIQRSLGRVEGKLDALIIEVKENNEAMVKQIDNINKRIEPIENFQNNLQGRMAVIGTVAAFLGSLITYLINFLIKKQ